MDRVWVVDATDPLRLGINLRSHHSVGGNFTLSVKDSWHLINWEEHVCEAGYCPVCVGAHLRNDRKGTLDLVFVLLPIGVQQPVVVNVESESIATPVQIQHVYHTISVDIFKLYQIVGERGQILTINKAE